MLRDPWAMSDPLKNPQFRRGWEWPPGRKKRESRPAGATFSSAIDQAGNGDRNTPRRAPSPYRRADGAESTIGCLVRRAVLKAGGRMKP